MIVDKLNADATKVNPMSKQLVEEVKVEEGSSSCTALGSSDATIHDRNLTSVKEFSEFLLHSSNGKLHKNHKGCIEFLLECVSYLRQQAQGESLSYPLDPTTAITTITTPSSTSSSQELAILLGETVKLHGEEELSCIQPRSKLLLSLYDHGLVLHPQKDNNTTNHAIMIPSTALLQLSASSSARYIIIFPKPEFCKEPSPSDINPNDDDRAKNTAKRQKLKATQQQQLQRLVLIPLHNVMYKNKSLPQICFPLPVAQPDPTTPTTKESSEQVWIDQLIDSFTTNQNNTNHRPTIIQISYPQVLKSSTATNNRTYNNSNSCVVSQLRPSMPFLSCYYGIHVGSLFLCDQGILFYKPPSFYAREQIRSISLDERGSTTRYVDLRLTVLAPLPNSTTTTSTTTTATSTEVIVFTNISREESISIQHYIQHITSSLAQNGNLALSNSITISKTINPNASDKGEGYQLLQDEEEDEEVKLDAVRKYQKENTTTSLGRKRRKAAIVASETTRRHFIATASANPRIDEDEEAEEQEDSEDEEDDDDYTSEPSDDASISDDEQESISSTENAYVT